MEHRREMRVNRIASPITVLGPGRRAGLWVQGCTLACDGCASVDTWSTVGGSSWDVDTVASRLVSLLESDGLTGLTITGGEPFQQAPAVSEVLAALRAEGALGGRDVLVFTGYAADRARRLGRELWDQADALVCGPYLPHRGAGGWLRASANQELVLRTDLAEDRYTEPAAPAVQVAAAAGGMTLAGLPAPGDLDRFRSLMAARGIEFTEVSWQR